MFTFSRLLFLGAIAVAAGTVSLPAMADATDVGPTPAEQTLTTTIVFKIHNADRLSQYIRETVTPGSAHYRKFLSVNQFRSFYAPSNGQIRQVVHYLNGFGITVSKVFADNLAINATGTVDEFNRAFDTQIENYEEPNPSPGHRGHFHRPKRQPRIPVILADDILAIAGLSNELEFLPKHVSAVRLPGGPLPAPVLPHDNSTATGVPGDFTVGDVANIYNVNPLYEEGITGAGTTVGIFTFANFDPNDAYTYWNLIGLTTTPNRIKQVHVDGGGDFGAAAGTGETSLDVEQSGGLAPNANIIVYDAPNSTRGGFDMIYQIVSDNQVDSLSDSWGLPEIFYFAGANDGVDETGIMLAMNQAFMEAAAQGMTLFTASGDSGAFDTVRSLGTAVFTAPLSVDSPSSSPFITAAGGTTVPTRFGLVGCDNSSPINITTEQAWGWDYLANFLHDHCGFSAASAKAAVFSVGDGGGVSVFWSRSWYQDGISGMRDSEPGQSLIETDTNPPFDFVDLPAGFAGRNTPDISMNADPETGYLVFSTPDGGLINFFGGTSFVAPQLNGIAALINQRAGGRIGFLNPQIYRLLKERGYGPGSPFNDIVAGDNWFYQGVTGYDPASGVGTPNAAALAEALAGGHRG